MNEVLIYDVLEYEEIFRNTWKIFSLVPYIWMEQDVIEPMVEADKCVIYLATPYSIVSAATCEAINFLIWRYRWDFLAVAESMIAKIYVKILRRLYGFDMYLIWGL